MEPELPAIALKAPPERADKRDQALTKANEAIAIRPRHGKLTLLSRRIYNALLYHSQRQGVDNAVYSLPLAELIGDARFNSNNTEVLKSSLRDMQATTIEWSTSGSGQKRWLSTQLIGTVSIEETGPGRPCIIRWSYPDEIRERLVKPNQYTKVILEMSARMRSYPAAALYELGARYLSSPSGLTMREDTIWWAAVLTGRSDIKTVDYRFLKRDTISRAIAEVDALCDEFSLELIEHKRGRKVEELQFRVRAKAQRSLNAIDDPSRNVFDLELIGRLIRIGIKQSDAQDLYAVTDEALLRGAVDHVEQRQRSQTLPALKSPPAYLRDALKKRYPDRPETATAPTRQIAPPSPPDPVQQMAAIREAWHADRSDRARQLYEEMDEPQRKETRARFEQAMLTDLPRPVASAWKQDATKSRIAASSFYRWFGASTWPAEPDDSRLFEFGIAKGLLQVSSAVATPARAHSAAPPLEPAAANV